MNHELENKDRPPDAPRKARNVFLRIAAEILGVLLLLFLLLRQIGLLPGALFESPSGTEELRTCYAEAEQLLKDQKFDDAYQAFLEIIQYKDSANMARECRYQKAELLLEYGDAQGAAAIFSTLGGYKNAASRERECRYAQALRYIEDGDWAGALPLLKDAGNYRDAPDLAAKAEEYIELARWVPYSHPENAAFDLDWTDPAKPKCEVYDAAGSTGGAILLSKYVYVDLSYITTFQPYPVTRGAGAVDDPARCAVYETDSAAVRVALSGWETGGTAAETVQGYELYIRQEPGEPGYVYCRVYDDVFLTVQFVDGRGEAQAGDIVLLRKEMRALIDHLHG